MTHLPTNQRYWHSETLNRRVTLAEVLALSDADLAMFRLELQDAATSIREQIEHLGDAANPEWKKRAIGKQRHAGLFVVAAGEEAHRRDRAMQLECSRLKNERVAENNRRRDAVYVKYAEVFHQLVAAEIGDQRVNDCRIRANRIVREMMEQS